jgi:D-serine deaminase-like pyridoxal phosphate-dependent protein
MSARTIHDLTTPALLVDVDAVEANLGDMAAALPGPRLRPHVKAHKTTALAARQAALGHHGFTCATVREVEGMAAAGLGADLLLANEVLAAHADVGGDVVSGGGTGTYAVNTWVTEVQAGSYALMDTAYTAAGLPFRQALTVLGTVVSATAPIPEVPSGWVVADVGLKSLGMDHGDPTVPGGAVWFCSDEHLTFSMVSPDDPRPAVGDRVRVLPAHIDPTIALHERMHLVRGDEVLDTWAVDLRGW